MSLHEPMTPQTDPADLPIPRDVPSLIIPLLYRLDVHRLGLLAELDLATLRSERSVGTKKWLALRDVVVQARVRTGIAGPLVRGMEDWDGRSGPWRGKIRAPSVLVEALLFAGITSIEALASVVDSGRIPGDPDDLLATLPMLTLQKFGDEVRRARSAVVPQVKVAPKKELPQPLSFADFLEAMRADVHESNWTAVLLRGRGGTLRQAGTLMGVTGERARQRIARALVMTHPVLHQAAADLLIPLEAQLADRVEGLDEVLTEHGLDSIAAFGLARLLLDREVPQVRYGAITLSPLGLSQIRKQALARIKEAGSAGLDPKVLKTGETSLSDEALQQLVGSHVTVLSNKRLQYVEPSKTATSDE